MDDRTPEFKLMIQSGDDARFALRGFVTVTLHGKSGEILFQEESKNIVVETGLNRIVSRLGQSSANIMNVLALGTGTTAAASNQTALVSEIVAAANRKAATLTSYATGTMRFEASWATNELNNYTIAEVGLFDTTAATAGVMFSRALFSTTIAKDSTQTLTVDYDIRAQTA